MQLGVSWLPSFVRCTTITVRHAAIGRESAHHAHGVVLCSMVSCRVVSCCVVLYGVVSCRVVSCRVVSCRVVSCRVVSCRVVSCRVVSCRVVSCRYGVMWCGVLTSQRRGCRTSRSCCSWCTRRATIRRRSGSRTSTCCHSSFLVLYATCSMCVTRRLTIVRAVCTVCGRVLASA
jgi:hypothetical protein